MPNDYVMDDEQFAAYAHTRLFSPDFTQDAIKNLRTIQLFPGILPSQLLDRLGDLDFIGQDNPREPIFIDRNSENIFIPVYSGNLRTHRYADMISRYLSILNQKPGFGPVNIDFIVNQVNKSLTQTIIEYGNMAYDFQKRVLLENPKSKREDRVMKPEMKNIDAIIIGHIDNVTDAWFGKDYQGDKVRKTHDEYLDWQVVDLDGKKVLCLDYVYGDQAGLLLGKMLREYATRCPGKEMNIYVFGKIGSLDPEHGRNTLAVPISVVNETNILRGVNDREAADHTQNLILLDDRGLYMKEIDEFAERYGVEALIGKSLNALSVPFQRKSTLETAIALGCKMVEMELLGTVLAIKDAKTNYSRQIKTDFGGVYFVSDNPLHGDTLADELDSDEGAMKSLEIIRKEILKKCTLI